MAKEKKKNGVPNKHLHARVSYLQEIATHLITATGKPSPFHNGHVELPPDLVAEDGLTANDNISTQPTGRGQVSGHNNVKKWPDGSARLASHLTQIARRSQIRLSPQVKHQICKHCATILNEDSTCKKYTENLSRNGRKAHANVLVIECGVCGTCKRFPIGAKRQAKKNDRQDAAKPADV